MRYTCYMEMAQGIIMVTTSTDTVAILATETQEHLAFMSWVGLYPWIKELMIHIPNEGMRTPRFGNKLKKMGMKKDVSDLFFAYPTTHYAGLWIELKRRQRYKITEGQKKWIELMRKVGYAAFIALGWEQARDIVLDYIKDSKPAFSKVA